MMPNTYVKVIRDWKASGGPDVYCPVDVATGKMYVGLSLIGFVPKGGIIVGEFDEKTDTLTLNKPKETVAGVVEKRDNTLSQREGVGSTPIPRPSSINNQKPTVSQRPQNI